jgi:hypothetical protein
MKNSSDSKYDIFLSELLIPISIVFGGFSIYMTLVVSLLFFPMIIASALLFGFSCMGISRMKQFRNKDGQG